jgi:hypothetical protein
MCEVHEHKWVLYSNEDKRRMLRCKKCSKEEPFDMEPCK